MRAFEWSNFFDCKVKDKDSTPFIFLPNFFFPLPNLRASSFFDSVLDLTRAIPTDDDPFNIDQRDSLCPSAFAQHLLFHGWIFFDIILDQIYAEGLKIFPSLSAIAAPGSDIHDNPDAAVRPFLFRDFTFRLERIDFRDGYRVWRWFTLKRYYLYITPPGGVSE